MKPLVQPLVDGPIDVVDDIHGDIEALTNLLGRLVLWPGISRLGNRRNGPAATGGRSGPQPDYHVLVFDNGDQERIVT